ncbi:uncharacterized protein LOC124490051 [Dermatophagoides farinae]|uniref:uncharacterized protein LOC124490051 n=1 Tax=Dermatophagoides farinae TaxID=6954 RepID=UPI003F642EC4
MDSSINGYLVESTSDGRIVGFFYGTYHQIKTPPPSIDLSKRLKKIRMLPFNPCIEHDELAEFRLLNHKNRVIIQNYCMNQQSNDDISMIWFGYDDDHQNRFITFNTNGVLVLCGHVSIVSTTMTTTNESSSPVEHYEGACTINLFGGSSFIEFNNNVIQIHLLSSSFGDHSNRFATNTKIPYRFLQRLISHRQRDMLKIDNKNKNDNRDDYHTIESLMSLETFDHLFY